MLGAEKIMEHTNKVSEMQVGMGWYYSIKYLTPMILVAIIFVKLTEISEGFEGYPAWALWVGAAMLPVSIITSMYLAGKVNAMLDEQEYIEEMETSTEDTEEIDMEGVEWTD